MAQLLRALAERLERWQVVDIWSSWRGPWFGFQHHLVAHICL